MRKLFSTTLACTMMFAFAATASANPFFEGYQDGQDSAEDIWVNDFAEDCNSFFVFVDECEKELIKKKYKKKKKDSWWTKEWKKGGKKGVEDFIEEIEEICLTPAYCDGMGESAATSLVADFCTAKGGNRMSITEMCRDEAIESCEGGIYDALEEWLNHGLDCPPINDDIDEVTFSDIRKMREKCEDRVDEMIDG